MSKKTDSSVVIVYKHLANQFGWPWSYEVFQTITLEDNNIFFELEILNKSNNPMPFGFGIHPYFNFNDKVKLKFYAEKEWVGSPEEFPIKTKIVENSFDYILLLEPTSPLTTNTDIDMSIKKLIDNNTYTSLLPVTKGTLPNSKFKFEIKNKSLYRHFNEKEILQRYKIFTLLLKTIFSSSLFLQETL